MRETVSGWVRGRRQWLVDCLGEKKHLPTIISLLSDTIPKYIYGSYIYFDYTSWHRSNAYSKPDALVLDTVNVVCQRLSSAWARLTVKLKFGLGKPQVPCLGVPQQKLEAFAKEWKQIIEIFFLKLQFHFMTQMS